MLGYFVRTDTSLLINESVKQLSTLDSGSPPLTLQPTAGTDCGRFQSSLISSSF